MNFNFQSDFGRDVPLFEVEATAVEPVFQNLYSYIFDVDNARYSAGEMDRPIPSAIFIVNFDKVCSLQSLLICEFPLASIHVN